MEVVFSLEEIDNVSQLILEQRPNKVILFNGNMGVGKTTLIKCLSKNLGVNGNTSSPTFSLVNEYQTNDNQIVYHFDCYRLKTEVEALDMGIDDYLYSGNWCFIEWPEKIESLIPEKCTTINIEILPNGFRKLIYK
ncbi:MAG: tRNA (adenosine(37)-N6)-threonylcarbamoyltransferase complex ATPase subunit type 1 TsaE [Flavobacterium sp.]|jgi:tRNA threonylcarbamoyladenosine biosynthesis protein TsaE|nr:tRNA (adenosine(37)-N6)-threonylcarbamoyltransferase complex ATPase subunit type 1 TsaE [Flavobacterium sp.]